MRVNRFFAVCGLILLLSFAALARTQEKSAEKSVTIFNAKIRYLEAGANNPQTVVLLHGLGGNAENWQFNIAALAAKYRVIVPDQIGFGKSDKPALPYRVGTYVDFLDKFLSELKVERATLIGNSMGGWIAATYAVQYPARVDRLVLVDAAGYAPPKDYNPNDLQLLVPTTRAAVRAVLPKVFYNSAALLNDAAVDAAIANRIAADDAATIQSLIESIKRGEDFIDGKLAAIKQPTLIIWGKQDGLIPVAVGEQMKREITNSQLVVFDQCGHLPQIEKALNFNQAVLKFLEGK